MGYKPETERLATGKDCVTSKSDGATRSVFRPSTINDRPSTPVPAYTPNAQRPTVHIMMGMRMMKSKSTQIPAFTILGRLTKPDP